MPGRSSAVVGLRGVVNDLPGFSLDCSRVSRLSDSAFNLKGP